MKRSIVFVDSGVEDYQSLLSGLAADVEVFVLDADKDGVLQMAQVLEKYEDLDAIHVISHGSSAALSLGSTLLTHDNLDDYKEVLKKIGASLSESGDLLLYGCNVAAEDEGLRFIEYLSQYTGADVAASDDLTGNINQSGDWDLEKHIGNIETIPLSSKDYRYLLADFDGTEGDDNLIGTALDDIFNASLLGGEDSMTGLGGDDIYYVDSVGDVVTENIDEGWDIVKASVTYTLSENIEILELQGTDAINGTGNELSNDIYGNDGDNILDGGLGNDCTVFS